MRQHLILAFVATSVVSLAFAAAPAPSRLAISAAALVAPDQGNVIAHPLALIEGDRIKEVRTDYQVPDGYTRIDLGSATLLPGLIDCHVHITGDATLSSGNYHHQDGDQGRRRLGRACEPD